MTTESPQRRWPVVAAIGAAIVVIIAVALTLVLLPEAPSDTAAAPLAARPSSSAPAVKGPGRAASQARQAAVQALPESKPVSLELPSIDVRSDRLDDLGLTASGALQVPADALTTGWFTGSPTPGEVGPAVLAAHVDYRHVPGVFFRLKEMRAGAEAIVHRGDGRTAVFTVYQVDHYPKSSFPTDKVYGDTAGPELRLITCGGDFDRASGNYLDNVVVYAKISKVYTS